MRWNYYKLRQLSLLQSAMDCYYKLRQLFYYKVRHGLLQIATGITKCDEFITNCDRYYKVPWLLQIAAVHNFIQNFNFLALFCISPRNLHNLYNNVMKISLRLITSNTLTFKDKPILRTGQKSALQRSLFWRFANFSNFMRTIHISMTSAFQCEYCQCFTFKRCDKFKLKCTSHGGMYISHYFGKISITSKQWILQRTFLTGS